MPKRAHGHALALAFDPVLTRRAASHQCHHDIAQAKDMVMYTGQRVFQVMPRTSPVLSMAAWAILPHRLPRYMDGGCAHALLVMSTLTNTLVRLQCGDRTRAIAIRVTTLEERPLVSGVESSQGIRSVRYRDILGLLLCPCSLVRAFALHICSTVYSGLGVLSQFTNIYVRYCYFRSKYATEYWDISTSGVLDVSAHEGSDSGSGISLRWAL